QVRVNKQVAFNAVIFVFLASNYLGLKLGLSIAGISITDAPGVAEGLLLLSNLMSCYTLVFQGNAYLLEAAIKHAINRAIPEELRAIYLARYFPHENFGLYQPFNLPHVIPNALSRGVGKIAAILFIALAFVATLTYMACNVALLLYFLWYHPKFGWL